MLIAKVGFQLSGGMTLMMPYLLPSGVILRIYSIGSRNSSSVGRYTGAFGMSKIRDRRGRSGRVFGCPLRSTVDKSKGSARRALRGIAWLLPDGGPFSVPGADGGASLACLAFAAASADEPGTGDAWGAGGACMTTGPPPVLGGTTIFHPHRPLWPRRVSWASQGR